MTGESTSTPQERSCVHQWKNVAGTSSPAGGRVVMCEKCNATKELNPPVQERGQDSRPLLTEG